MLRFSKALAKQSFQPVAFHRRRDLFTRYREPEARGVADILTDKNRDAGVSTSKIILEDLLKLESTR